MDKILCIIWEQTTLNISYVLQVNRDPMLSLSYFRISRRSPKASTQWTETGLSNSLASSSCPRSTSTCEWLLTATLPLWIWKVYLCSKNRQQKLSRNSDASLHHEVLTCSHYARKTHCRSTRSKNGNLAMEEGQSRGRRLGGPLPSASLDVSLSVHTLE
jgi:hypothetical protein